MDINENWSVYTAYTSTEAIYIGSGLGAEADAALDIFPGNRVVNTPDSMWVVSLDWNRGPLLRRAVEQARGRSFRQPAATTGWRRLTRFSDLYFKVRGEALPDFLQDLDFGIVVNNLFDESYLGGIAGGGAWIAAPRTAAFTATLDF